MVAKWKRVVSAVFICGEKVFLCLEWSNGAKGDYWFTPGGKVKGREKELAAMKRELREELGLRPEFLNQLCFRRYYGQRVVWGGQKLYITHFLIELDEKFQFHLLAKQKKSGWFSKLPDGGIPEQVDVLFLKLRLDGLIPKS